MLQALTKEDLQKTIAQIVAQTELFPDLINQQAQNLDQSDLEKLTITLYVAQKSSEALNEAEQTELKKNLHRYFDGKKRIYQKTQTAWLAHQEQKQEAQECLFEADLLKAIE